MPCEERAGLERDTCLSERMAVEEDIDAATALAVQLEDRIVRHAAVLTWVEAHRDADRQKLQALCALLDGDHAVICARRVDAAHLR